MVTMNSDSIFMLLETIAKAKGNEKKAILANYADDEELKAVLSYALNPTITYGITAGEHVNPDFTGEGTLQFNDDLWVLLDGLSLREVTGTAAEDAVQRALSMLTPRSAALFARIIQKDLRCGLGASTVNSVIKDLIPQFPYERCSLPSKVPIESWDWDKGIISQEKADGMYATFDYLSNGEILVRSRQGSLFRQDSMGELIAQAKKYLKINTQTQGEFLVYKDGEILPREKSNGVMNRILDGGQLEYGEQIRFLVWNQIPLDDAVPKGKCSIPYGKRLASLIKQMNTARSEIGDDALIRLIPTSVVTSLKEALEHTQELLKEGKEGTIIKQKEGLWKDGTAKHQVKLKLEVDVDLKIVEVLPGNVGTKNEGLPGRFSCASADDKLFVDVTVKNEKLRSKINKDWDAYVGKIITVRANSILSPSESNENYSLFLPRMAEEDYRTDKDVADTLEQIQDQFDSAIDKMIEKYSGGKS